MIIYSISRVRSCFSSNLHCDKPPSTFQRSFADSQSGIRTKHGPLNHRKHKHHRVLKWTFKWVINKFNLENDIRSYAGSFSVAYYLKSVNELIIDILFTFEAEYRINTKKDPGTCFIYLYFHRLYSTYYLYFQTVSAYDR